MCFILAQATSKVADALIKMKNNHTPRSGKAGLHCLCILQTVTCWVLYLSRWQAEIFVRASTHACVNVCVEAVFRTILKNLRHLSLLGNSIFFASLTCQVFSFSTHLDLQSKLWEKQQFPSDTEPESVFCSLQIQMRNDCLVFFTYGVRMFFSWCAGGKRKLFLGFVFIFIKTERNETLKCLQTHSGTTHVRHWIGTFFLPAEMLSENDPHAF